MAPKHKPVRLIKLHGKAHRRDRYYKYLPWLNVSGVWLEQAGFNIGDMLEIHVCAGQLTIIHKDSNGDQSH